MRISVAADELTGVARALPEELRRRGHEPVLHGAYSEAELGEILDAWFGGDSSSDASDVANIAHLEDIERS